MKTNLSQEKTALVVFAREPRPGKVKTRLIPFLDARTVTRLYRAFVEDVLNEASRVACSVRFLYYHGQPSHIPFLRKFEGPYVLKRQTGTDLGERMHRAFRFCHEERYTKTVMIGTDCLGLRAQDIRDAFEGLENHDVVLGPSLDGGYYLIALKNPCSILFQGIPWGTPDVLRQTRAKIRDRRWKLYELALRRDIDVVEDLQAFYRERRDKKRPGDKMKTMRLLRTMARGVYKEVIT